MTETNPPRCEMDAGDKVGRNVRQRRQLLIGSGAAASLVTVLWNRPSFGARGACTHSVWRSHLTGGAAFLSQGPVPTSGCGDTPACWAKSGSGDWLAPPPPAPAGMNFSPGTPFSTVFNIPNKYWTLAPSNGTLLSALNGTLRVYFQTNTSQTLAVDLCAQVVAALLNANWYKSAYDSTYNSAAVVISQVNSYVFSTTSYSAGYGAANSVVSTAQGLNNNPC
jgi:hypothetical protein